MSENWREQSGVADPNQKKETIEKNNLNTKNLPPLPPLNYKSQVKKEDELLPSIAYASLLSPILRG
ncbi:MAG: hypothetical protein HC817_01645 [Saprospiraceae bacterium]|nr:hypothetical protein [Saprospiraceae bacterium]